MIDGFLQGIANTVTGGIATFMFWLFARDTAPTWAYWAVLVIVAFSAEAPKRERKGD